eukprot:TRINITY_DN518_c0_g1_i2.p1 TRINITY_DN518_c0_g1~~TRINITY_DN518_c0_g1_i2.p1  ORF type:complete len:179 (-),score=31.22 TRINITY_DN518_c0_g1_i2:13-519(-)
MNIQQGDPIEIKTPKIFKSFKSFLSKTIAVELIVGLVIAASLQTIIRSALNDIILPLTIGLLFGSNTENLILVLKPGDTPNASYDTPKEAMEDGALTLNYGNFLNEVLRFIVMVIFLFFFIRFIGGLAKKINWKESHLNKNCDQCCKSVDYRATRCPYCTADITDDEI